MEATSQLRAEVFSIDFACVNCDSVVVVSSRPTLYCSLRCQQNAKFVRYFRGCIKDGRIQDPLVREAIRTRLAFAFSERGYYDERTRKIPFVLRKQVIERYKGLCRKCGAEGSEIDHVASDQNKLENLQLLCRDCHSQKTVANLIPLTPAHEKYSEIRERAEHLRSRVVAVAPQRPCDDDRNWNTIYSQIIAGQRQLLKQAKEDLEGRSGQHDEIEEHRIAQEIEELNELYSQKNVLELQKQARIDEVITTEIKSKLDAIEAEFDELFRLVEENVRIVKERIGQSVLRHGSTVKGTGFQIVYYKARVLWDSKALDAYALSHPDILRFRTEGTARVQFRRIDRRRR